METCTYGSGAGLGKPTAVMRQGVSCRAYSHICFFAYRFSAITVDPYHPINELLSWEAVKL